MPIYIRNARILTPFVQQAGDVLVMGNRIVEINRGGEPPRGATVIDAENMYLAPGYIDLHVHGGGGREMMECSVEAVRAVCAAHAQAGTTTLLLTTDVAPLKTLGEAVDTVRAAQAEDCAGTIAGVHVQTPFCAADQVRPEAIDHLCTPASTPWQEMIGRWEGVRMIGLAPELPGALEMADVLREKGIIASISHSSASYEQVHSAVIHGFSDVTNIYSGCSTLRRAGGFRIPGVSECALTMEELTIQLAADGIELPMMLIQIICRCRNPESIMLVSKGRADGKSNMARMVQNMVAAGIAPRVALRMATVNPARRLKIDDHKGRIAQGYDADLLLLDETMTVRLSMAKGVILHNNLEMPSEEDQ